MSIFIFDCGSSNIFDLRLNCTYINDVSQFVVIVIIDCNYILFSIPYVRPPYLLQQRRYPLGRSHVFVRELSSLLDPSNGWSPSTVPHHETLHTGVGEEYKLTKKE